MSGLKVKTSHFISRPDPKKVWVSSVLLPFHQEKGAIFGLIKILGTVTEPRQRLAAIVEDHLSRFEQTMTENVNIPRRFEQVLQAINEDIHTFMNDKHPIPLTDVHAVIGVFHDKQIFLSGLGSLSVLFMHRTAKQRYVIYELDQQFSLEVGSWEKLFVTVLDGELHPGDVFYVGTRLSGRELGIGDLQDILVTLPPSGALKRIQQHVQIGSPYGGIALQVLDKAPVGPPKKTNPFTSIEQLGKTKHETAELLGEQSPDITGWLNRIVTPLMEQLASPGTKGAKSTGKRLLRLIVKMVIGTVAFSITLGKQAVQLVKSAYQSFADRRKGVEQNERPSSHQTTKIKPLLQKLITLPNTAKFAVLGAVVLLFLLIGTVSFLNSSTSKKESQIAFTTIVTRIEEKKNAAEASLIYEDKDQARTLLSEAVALLESLSVTTREQESTVESIRNDLNTVFYALRGVTEVDVTTLATINESQITSTSEANGVIYSVLSNNQVYRFNELSLTFEPLNMTVGTIGAVKTMTGEGPNLLFIDDTQRLGRVEMEANAIKPITSGVEALSSAEDLVLYNDNLYVLSAASQQISKMRPQATGFEAGTNWITSLLSTITDARALAVDGDLYVLTGNDIKKFNTGKELTFAFETVDPILKQPADIWTTVGTDFIYVLDPQESRVVVYSKSGNLVAQYVNEALKDGRNLIVREDKNAILVGTSSQLLQFTATHLVQ